MRRFVFFVVTATLGALCYVYTEVGAVKTGYEIRKQEETKARLLDRGRALQYHIAAHQAPHHLERRLQVQHVQLEPPKSWGTLVIQGAAPRAAPTFAQRISGAFSGNRFPWTGRFLVGTAQAEAKES